MFNNHPPHGSGSALRKSRLSSSHRWLTKAHEILHLLENDKKEIPVSASTAQLLRQAHDLIEESERRIAELERLSSTDELTGIMNRRGFVRNFERELDRVNRDKSQGGLLIMIDLDNFKTINDMYGHEAGDIALKVVASTLANDIRIMDITARIGGDEFVILFVNTSRKDALDRAQFLIRKLNNLSFVWQGEEVPIRASLGLKEYKKGSEIRNIFTQADANMYENKRQVKDNNPHKQNSRMV